MSWRPLWSNPRSAWRCRRASLAQLALAVLWVLLSATAWGQHGAPVGGPHGGPGGSGFGGISAGSNLDPNADLGGMPPWGPPPGAPGQTISDLPFTMQIGPPDVAPEAGDASPLGADPLIGVPLLAEFTTKHRQHLKNGNNISLVTYSRLRRDGEGRIRRESQLSVPGLSLEQMPVSFVIIVDNQQGYGYIFNTGERIARRFVLRIPGTYVAHLNVQERLSAKAAAPPPANGSLSGKLRSWLLHQHGANETSTSAAAPADAAPPSESYVEPLPMHLNQPFLTGPNAVRNEVLGERTFLGYRAQGKRVVTTVEPGKLGNDHPIEIVSEQWYSPELGMVLSSMHRDPWAGEISTSVTHIKRGAQVAKQFQVPSSYKVIDAESEPERRVLDDARSSAR